MFSATTCAAALDAGAGVAPDFAFAHHAPGNRADARDAEDLPHFGDANRAIRVDRLQHALERQFDIFQQLVDHRVQADFDVHRLGMAAGCRIDVHVEAEDDRAGRARQHHVAFADVAHVARQDAQLDPFGVVLFNRAQRVDNRLQRPLHVHLDDQVEFFGLALAVLREDVFQRNRRASGRRARLVGGCPGALRPAPRAIFSFLTTSKVSPAIGMPLNPSTATGVEGPALLTVAPVSSYIAFRRP